MICTYFRECVPEQRTNGDSEKIVSNRTRDKTRAHTKVSTHWTEYIQMISGKSHAATNDRSVLTQRQPELRQHYRPSNVSFSFTVCAFGFLHLA